MMMISDSIATSVSARARHRNSSASTAQSSTRTTAETDNNWLFIGSAWPIVGLNRQNYIVDVVDLRSQDRDDSGRIAARLEQDGSSVISLVALENRLDVEQRRHDLCARETRQISGRVTNHSLRVGPPRNGRGLRRCPSYVRG